MTDIERYIQHDLDDLMKSVEHDPLDNQTKDYLWKQAGALLRYQNEIGTISDYVVDVRLSDTEVRVVLRYKLLPTDVVFRKAEGRIVTLKPLSAAQLPPQQGGGTYNGGNGHGTYSIGVTGTTPMSNPTISAPNIPNGILTGAVIPGNGIGTVTSQLNVAKSRSPKLPPIIFEEQDDAGAFIRMTLAPDWQLTANDSLKISMMLFSAATQPFSFSAQAYVKANQLERHFTFKTV